MVNSPVGMQDQLNAIRDRIKLAPQKEIPKEESSVRIPVTGDSEEPITIEIKVPSEPNPVSPLHIEHLDEIESFRNGVKEEIKNFKTNSRESVSNSNKQQDTTQPQKEIPQDPEDIELERRFKQSEIERNKAAAKELTASARLQTGVAVTLGVLAASGAAMVCKALFGGRK